MTENFSYSLIGGWHKADVLKKRGYIEGLTPEQTHLLLSDGSMTLDLERHFGSDIEVELKGKKLSKLDSEAASFLEESAQGAAMERQAWLGIKGKKLLYAQSIMPINCVEKRVLEKLEEREREPMGRVLSAIKVVYSKDRLEVGIVKCPGAANDLSISPEAALFARRYVLFNMKGPDSWIIKAAVTEVFSPEVISPPEATLQHLKGLS